MLITPFIGAKFYYLWNVLHDYSDEECRTLLRNTKDAMSAELSIIINELVLPDKIESEAKESEVNASLDMLLMASLAG
jgi:demethylsterigmatocystin 6-O-methyltransferase